MMKLQARVQVTMVTPQVARDWWGIQAAPDPEPSYFTQHTRLYVSFEELPHLSKKQILNLDTLRYL